MKIFLLVVTLLVIIGIVIATFRFWLHGTHGEVGPAIVATIVTIAVIGLAIFTMIKVQEAKHIQEFEEGRAPVTAHEDASA